MGTKTKLRRNGRARRRGLATFVSFVMLFAFALGQGSSLLALADDGILTDEAGLTQTASTDGSTEASADASTEAPAEETAPVEEAPAEAPAEEAPAEEARADEAPAEEAPAEETPSVGSAATSDGGSGRTRTARVGGGAGGGPGIQSHGGLHGRDVSLDFVAAGPFTYDHGTGLGTYPTFGYNDRTISKTDGVVESLEGGDFACDDLVTFFVQVAIADDADGSGTVELDMSFGAETTGQPGLGFDEIVSYGINTPDDGNVGNVTDNVVTLAPPGGEIETAGYDELKGTFTVTNLAPGETAIVRMTVHLACEVGGDPTGNILNAIEGARADDEKVNVGQETVPMKQVGGIAAAPAISVIKDCPEFSLAGEEITYEITVSNEGNEALVDLSVTDTLLGDITDEFPDTTLEVGEINTVTVGYTPEPDDPDPLTNTVTAEADGDISDMHVSDTADCVTDVLNPDITITKSCPDFAQVGDTITYTIRVTNSGDEALENITVEDTILGDLSDDFVDTLAPGAFDEQTFDYEVTDESPDPIENTVTAEANGVQSEEVVDSTADCVTDVLNPDITVTKSCPDFAQVGDTITYTIRVTNSGDEALENITVEDTILGDLSDDFVDTLAPGAFDEQTFDYEVTDESPDPIENTVTAEANGVQSEEVVDSTADCVTDVLNPDIDIVKDGPALVHVGDTITYTFVVTNTGEVDLFEVVLTDPICDEGTIEVTDDGDGDTTLAVDEVWRFECLHLVTDEDPDPIPNTAVVRGEDRNENEVTADDDHVVDIIHPAIHIEKTVSEEIVPVGTTVTYTYVITNIGDTTLFDVTVVDDIMGFIGEIAVLEPGDSFTLTKDFVVGDEVVINVAVAEGEDETGRSVSDDDDAIVTPIAGEGPPPPPPAPPTPFTGSDAGRLGLISMALFGIGVTVVAATRRRRPQREAA
jgi:uncharacterized repeat protein (TIGR01451 family)